MEDSNPNRVEINKVKELELKHTQVCEYVARFEPPPTDGERGAHALLDAQQKSLGGAVRRIYNGVRSIIGPWGGKRSVSEPMGRDLQTDVDHADGPSKHLVRKSDPLNQFVPQEVPSERLNDAKGGECDLSIPTNHEKAPLIPTSKQPSGVPPFVNVHKSGSLQEEQMGEQTHQLKQNEPISQSAQENRSPPVLSTPQPIQGSGASKSKQPQKSFEVYRDQEAEQVQVPAGTARVPVATKNGQVRAQQAPRAHRTDRIQKAPPVRQLRMARQAGKTPQTVQAVQVARGPQTPKTLRNRQLPRDPPSHNFTGTPGTPKILQVATTPQEIKASQTQMGPHASHAPETAQPEKPAQRKPLNAHLVERLNGQRPVSAAVSRPSAGLTNSLRKNPSQSSVIDRLLQPTRASAAKSNVKKLPFEGDASRNNSKNSLGLRNSSNRAPRTLSSNRSASNSGINTYAQNVSLLRKPPGAANVAQQPKRHPLAQVHANKQKAQSKPTKPVKPALVKPTPAKPGLTKPALIKPALAKPAPVKPVDLCKPPQAVKATGKNPVSLTKGNQHDERNVPTPHSKSTTCPNPAAQDVPKDIKGILAEAAKQAEPVPAGRKRSYKSDEPSIDPPKAKRTRNTAELEDAHKDIQTPLDFPQVAKPLFANDLGANNQAPPNIPRQDTHNRSDWPFTPRTALHRRQQNAKLPTLDSELLKTTNQDIVNEYKLDMKVRDSSWSPPPRLSSAYNTPSKPKTPMKLNETKNLVPSSFPMLNPLFGDRMARSTPYKATKGQEVNLVPLQLNAQQDDPVAVESSMGKFTGNSDINLSANFLPAEWAKGDNLYELFAQQGERSGLKDSKKLDVRLCDVFK